MSVLINFKICDNAPECSGVEVCETGALYWNKEKNKIEINNSKCINCGKCEKACPVDAIKVAKTNEEFETIKKEIDKDPRRISDLFVDRYGAIPIDPDTLINEKYFANIFNLTKSILIEFFNDESIRCLRKSIPINKIIKHKDILFRKINIKEDSLPNKFKINKFPCLLFFKDNQLIGKIEGYYNIDEFDKLKEKINKIIN